MFFSRIWFLLVTLFAVVLTVAFFLAPRPAEYRLDESLEKQLDVAQGLVDLHMQIQSRKRLDVLSNIGKEPRIARPLLALQSPEKPEKEDPKEKPPIEELKNALEEANKKSGFNADNIVITDRKGRVRASHGGGGKVDDSMAGLPEIKHALRGYCMDNTIQRGGALYWVFSCPVRLVREGENIQRAGAIRAEIPIDNDFVSTLAGFLGASQASEEDSDKEEPAKAALGLELCFYAGDRPVAWTTQTEIWAKYGPVFQKKHEELLSDKSIGRSPAETIRINNDKYLMVLGRLPGSASGPGNYWSILWKFPATLGPFAFLSGQTPREHLLMQFPYIWVIMGSILGLILGMFLLLWEGDIPSGRLLKQARSLISGEKEKLEETKFRGKFSLIAIAVNEALEKAAERSSGKPALHDKDLNEVLGEIEPRIAEDDYSPPPPSPTTAPPALKEASPLGSVLPPESKTTDSNKPPTPPPFGGQKGIRPATMVDPSAASTKAFAGEPAVGGGGRVGGLPGEEVPSDVEAHFKDVFDEFVSKKQACNENVAALTYETFRKQLIKSRDQIMASQACKGVRFEVYIKAGKAALKAHPVKS